MRTKRLTLQQRREIFSTLVQTQDQGTLTVPESRKAIIDHFKISDVQLRQSAEEGLDKEWPPLKEELIGRAASAPPSAQEQKKPAGPIPAGRIDAWRQVSP